MPTSQKKTSKTLRPKGKAAKPKKPILFGGPRDLAPASVAGSRRQLVWFSGSTNSSDLVMHTQVPLFTVNKSTSSVTVGTGMTDFSGSELISCQLNLTDPAALRYNGVKSASSYLSPIFDLIGSAFTKYRVRKLVFCYEPQASSTDSQRLVFAFAADPVHPVLWNATPPTSSSLLSVSDSKPFAPWEPWEMDVSSSLSQEFLFTYSNSSTTVSEFSERFSDLGVISLVTSSVNTTTSSCGILYAQMEVELKEFCPISVTRPALANLASKISKAPVTPPYQKPKVEGKEDETTRIRRRLAELQKEISDSPTTLTE